MKTHVIASCILLAIGYQQCAANLADQVDPLGIYLSGQGVGISSTYVQQPGQPSALDVAIKTAYPLDQQLLFTTESPIQLSTKDTLNRIASPLKKTVRSIIHFVKSVISVAIKVIQFLLSPLTLVFNVTKFFANLFFLPVTLGWKIFKVMSYPVTLLFNKLTAPNYPPPYVIGLPKQISYASSIYGP